ncbi:MAG: hypothetical protein ACYDEQ_04890 [Desulfocucumaceae bacterium]
MQKEINYDLMEKEWEEVGDIIARSGDIFVKSNIKPAEKICKKNLAIYPDNQALHYYSGVVNYYNGKLKNAKACFEKVVERGSDYLWALIGAEVYLGLINDKLGLVPEAENCLLNAVELDPCWVTHWYLAEYYYNKLKKGKDYSHFKKGKDNKYKYLTANVHDAKVLKKGLNNLAVINYKAALRYFNNKVYKSKRKNTNANKENIDLFCHLSPSNTDLVPERLQELQAQPITGIKQRK